VCVCVCVCVYVYDFVQNHDTFTIISLHNRSIRD